MRARPFPFIYRQEAMARSLFSLFGGHDDGSMHRVVLPATAWWNLPPAMITERPGRREAELRRRREQRQRCLSWLLQRRGLA